MDFDVSKLTPDQITALAGKLGPALKQTISEGVVSAVTDQLKQSLGAEVTRQVTDTVKTQVAEAMKAAQPKDDPKPDANKDKKDGEVEPEWAVRLNKRLEAIEGDKKKAQDEATAAAEKAATLKLATETLAARRPNIKKESLLVYAKDIAARGPKTADEVMSVLEDLAKNHYPSYGIDIKPLLADAGAEGAKPAPGTPEAKKEALREKIKSDAKAGAL